MSRRRTSVSSSPNASLANCSSCISVFQTNGFDKRCSRWPSFSARATTSSALRIRAEQTISFGIRHARRSTNGPFARWPRHGSRPPITLIGVGGAAGSGSRLGSGPDLFEPAGWFGCAGRAFSIPGRRLARTRTEPWRSHDNSAPRHGRPRRAAQEPSGGAAEGGRYEPAAGSDLASAPSKADRPRGSADRNHGPAAVRRRRPSPSPEAGRAAAGAWRRPAAAPRTSHQTPVSARRRAIREGRDERMVQAGRAKSAQGEAHSAGLPAPRIWPEHQTGASGRPRKESPHRCRNAGSVGPSLSCASRSL